MKFLRFISMLMLCCGCTGSTSSFKKGDLSKIILGTGYCVGECPFQAIEIDSSLTYKYFGGAYADNEGYFKGIIAKSFWNSLNSDLEELEYWNLDTIYDDTYDDQAIEIIIYKGNRRKHIQGQYGSLPKNLQNLVSKLSYSVALANLKPIKDAIKFETTIHIQPTFVAPKFPPPAPKPAIP